MIKKLIITLLLLCLVAIGNPVFAENDNDYLNSESIEALYNQYLNNHNAEDRGNLSITENNELTNLIQEFKDYHFGDSQSATFASTRAHWSDFTGGIFVHYDSQSGSWAHGHAAIGRGLGTVEILNWNSVVSYYGASRVQTWYGANSGGYFTVRGAYYSDSQAASDNAYNKRGTGYWLIGNTGEWGGYTCSYLVAESWNDAGFYLGGGRAITPAGLENSARTVLQFRWVDVSY